jgi:hypothetical protein
MVTKRKQNRQSAINLHTELTGDTLREDAKEAIATRA